MHIVLIMRNTLPARANERCNQPRPKFVFWYFNPVTSCFSKESIMEYGHVANAGFNGFAKWIGTMKGIVQDHFGPAEVLHLADVPMPSMRSSDLLVRVAAAGVNCADILQRDGPASILARATCLVWNWRARLSRSGRISRTSRLETT